MCKARLPSSWCYRVHTFSARACLSQKTMNLLCAKWGDLTNLSKSRIFEFFLRSCRIVLFSSGTAAVPFFLFAAL